MIDAGQFGRFRVISGTIASQNDSIRKMRTRYRGSAARIWGFRAHGLLGRDVAARLGKALDPLLDVCERCEAGFDRLGRDVLQNVCCNGVAQAVEIIDKLTAARCEKQSVSASIPGVVPSFEKTVLDQTIEQAHKRDRLQFKYIREIDLRQSFLLPQSEQYDPLRARGAAALGAVVDVIAQQARAIDELRNQLALQIERHERGKAFQKFRFLKL